MVEPSTPGVPRIPELLELEGTSGNHPVPGQAPGGSGMTPEEGEFHTAL